MMRLIFLSWIAGIALIGLNHHLLHYLNFPYWGVVASIAFIFIVFFWLKTESSQFKLWRIVLKLVLSFSVFACGWQFADWQLEKRLALEVKYNQTVEGIVYIDQLSDGKIENWRQKAKLLIPDQNQTLQILLYPKKQYSEDGEVIGLSTDAFKIGEFYQVTVEIKPPHGYVNVGGFDQEKWLLQENIQATASVLYSEPISSQQVIQKGWYSFVVAQNNILERWQLKIEKLRQSYRDHLLISEHQSDALLLGLLTGDRSGISKETIQLYQYMGISHLLAISGPHVLILATMLTWCLMAFLHFLMRRGFLTSLYIYIPKQRLYLPIFISIVSFYVAFTGFEIPALRTWVIATVCAISLWLRFKISAFSLLLFAACIVLVLDCFAILSAAFWLSFGASAILLLIYQQISKQKVDGYLSVWDRCKILIDLLWQSQWRIFIALMPIVLWQFKAVSLIAPLINLIAIPFLSLIIVPLDIVAAVIWQVIPFLGNAIWSLTALLILIFNYFLYLLEDLAKWLYLPSSLTQLQLFCLAIVLIILSLPYGLIHRIWAAFFILPIVLESQSAVLKMDVLDVGQGQAVFVRTAHHQILVDTGGGSWQKGQLSMGDRVLVPFLRHQGVRELDELLLTHLDLDHRGGAPAVMDHIKVKQVRSNEYDAEKLELDSKTPFLQCQQGQSWQWDEVQFEILWPTVNTKLESTNESSCVLIITAPMQNQQLKILLMGDTGWQAEYQILQQYPDLKSDILVLGHHGSKYSSAYDFIKQIDPDVAISSAGIDNRYGHPTPEAIARLNDLQIPHLSTIKTGRIHLSLDADHGFWKLQQDRQRYKWLEP